MRWWQRGRIRLQWFQTAASWCVVSTWVGHPIQGGQPVCVVLCCFGAKVNVDLYNMTLLLEHRNEGRCAARVCCGVCCFAAKHSRPLTIRLLHRLINFQLLKISHVAEFQVFGPPYRECGAKKVEKTETTLRLTTDIQHFQIAIEEFEDRRGKNNFPVGN